MPQAPATPNAITSWSGDGPAADGGTLPVAGRTDWLRLYAPLDRVAICDGAGDHRSRAGAAPMGWRGEATF